MLRRKGGTVGEDRRSWDLPSLVKASVDHDEDAWNELVRRFAGLVAYVIRHYRLSAQDTQDVSQLVWLHLVEHLGHIREPAALPGWLATTTRHECERFMRLNGRVVAMDPLTMMHVNQVDDEGVDGTLLAAERRQVLVDGLAELAPRHRELLAMLAADPPYNYTQISTKLGIPIGSIGPTRSRILAKLRETGAVKAYLEANGEAARMGGLT